MFSRISGYLLKSLDKDYMFDMATNIRQLLLRDSKELAPKSVTFTVPSISVMSNDVASKVTVG